MVKRVNWILVTVSPFLSRIVLRPKLDLADLSKKKLLQSRSHHDQILGTSDLLTLDTMSYCTLTSQTPDKYRTPFPFLTTRRKIDVNVSLSGC